MKAKFFTLIVAALLLSNISFAQFVQQGTKLVGTGAVGGWPLFIKIR